MQYDINKILDKIESESLGDLINAKKKDKYYTPFQIPVLDQLINFTNNKIKYGTCFEITGPTCSGKTELLIQIITTILINNLEIIKEEKTNNTSQNSELNGLLVTVHHTPYIIRYKPTYETVYYFDCDHRFNFSNLVHRLKHQILQTFLHYPQTNPLSNAPNQYSNLNSDTNIKTLTKINQEEKESLQKILRMCLKYFNLVRPLNTFSLIVSLLKLKDIYPSFLTIMIDSISMFYYMDMEEEAARRNLSDKKKMDPILTSTLLYRQLNKLLKLLSQKYSITLFLTTRQDKKINYYNTGMSQEGSKKEMDVAPMIVNDALLQSLHRSVMHSSPYPMEYFSELQSNQLIFKNLYPEGIQEYAVYQEDLIHFRLVLSKHPENLLERPIEDDNNVEGWNDRPNPTENPTSHTKILCCLTYPIKTNILEFEITEHGIC